MSVKGFPGEWLPYEGMCAMVSCIGCLSGWSQYAMINTALASLRSRIICAASQHSRSVTTLSPNKLGLVESKQWSLSVMPQCGEGTWEFGRFNTELEDGLVLAGMTGAAMHNHGKLSAQHADMLGKCMMGRAQWHSRHEELAGREGVTQTIQEWLSSTQWIGNLCQFIRIFMQFICTVYLFFNLSESQLLNIWSSLSIELRILWPC